MFGIVEKDSRKTRFFFVEDRKKSTLQPILLRYVYKDSIIHSDQWTSYHDLGNFFKDHKTVNHSKVFVDPYTLANTQKIECIWSHVKLRILRNERGVPEDSLQSHLDLFSYKYFVKDKHDPFVFFMKLIKSLQ